MGNLFEQTYPPSNAIQLRDEGMSLAAKNRAGLLKIAKEKARALAPFCESGISSDDIRVVFLAEGLSYTDLGNAAGSIFRGSEWVCVGRKQSQFDSTHAREIKVWKLKTVA